MKAYTLAKYYKYIIFPPSVIRKAKKRLLERIDEIKSVELELKLDLESNYFHEEFDNEDEFFNSYRQSVEQSTLQHAKYEFSYKSASVDIIIQPKSSSIVGIGEPGTMVRIHHKSKSDALYILDVFEDAKDHITTFKILFRPTIFIGHGQNAQWRDLKDHLQQW